MKLVILCFVLSGLEALVFTFNNKGQNVTKIAHATSVEREKTPTQARNLRVFRHTSSETTSLQQNKNDEDRALQFNFERKMFTEINHYLIYNLQRSVESLLNWEKIVKIMNPVAEPNKDANGQRGHFAEMKVKKELTFFILLIILKTLGVLVTKIKITIGMIFLKLIIGKLILLFMHLKQSKHHAGPLIKAYQTTTNEFHNHLGHHKFGEFNNEEPFFPSPPNVYIHDSSMRKLRVK